MERCWETVNVKKFGQKLNTLTLLQSFLDTLGDLMEFEDERREFDRFEISVSLSIVEDQKYEFTSKNISAKGVLFENNSNFVFLSGQLCSITLNFDGSTLIEKKSKEISLTAKVLRCEKLNIAMSFEKVENLKEI